MEDNMKKHEKERFNIYVAMIGTFLFTLILVVAIFFLVHYINRDIILVVHKNGNNRNIEVRLPTHTTDM